MHKKLSIAIIAFMMILLFFCVTYYHELLFHLPYGIHTWAQSDRLSLAVNFYDHGMNFFKPATHNIYSVQSITGVEFPVQAYIAALAGKIFGREYISISFRLLNVFISCTGLLFLFLAAYRATKDFIVSIVTPLFVFCSPVFIYYTCNYLPDTASASIGFIAFYYVLRYIDSLSVRHFTITVLLLTLATMVKTSVGLYLCGFLLVSLYVNLTQQRNTSKSNAALYTVPLLSIAVIVGYYLYNQHLNNTYHSEVFLAKANPFRNMADVSRFLNDFKHVWIKEYFILPQYLLMAACIAAAIPLLFQTKNGKTKLLLWLVFLFGVIAMAVLMGQQLYHHDYYAVSIFLPLLTFAMLVSVITIRNAIQAPVALLSVRSVFLVAVLICFFMADYHIHQRLQNGVAGLNPGISWAEGGADVFSQLNIGKDESILVLDADDPNTQLLLFDRKGINICYGKWDNVGDILPVMHQHNIRIIVCEEGLGHALLTNDSTLQSRFNTLYIQNRKAIFRMK